MIVRKIICIITSTFLANNKIVSHALMFSQESAGTRQQQTNKMQIYGVWIAFATYSWCSNTSHFANRSRRADANMSALLYVWFVYLAAYFRVHLSILWFWLHVMIFRVCFDYIMSYVYIYYLFIIKSYIFV